MYANLESVNDFFKSTDIQFFIPIYQREYKWKKENTQTLLDDFHNILDKKYSNHFIGTILFKNFNKKNNTIEKELIDGQQRVTTLFLFFVALKRIANENGDNQTAQRITRKFLENEYVDENFKIRFKPNSSQNQIFSLIIEDQLVFSKAEKRKYRLNNLYESYKLIYDNLKTWVEVEEIPLIEILNMLNDINLVSIKLEEKDEVDVHKIFESINSTGLELSDLDLIRNYLMMGLDSENQERIYASKWIPFEDKLVDLEKRSIVKIDKFLTAFLQFQCKKYIKKSEVYQEFKNYAANKSSEEIFTDLDEAIELYKHIYDIDLEKNPNKITYLNFFKFDPLNNTMYAPFLMRIFDLYETNQIHKVVLEISMKWISNYVLRRKMFNLDTSAISRLFADTLLTKLNNKPIDQTLVDFIQIELYENTRNTAMYCPSDEQLIQYFETLNAYSMSTTSKTLLWILETWNSYDSLIYQEMTLEHIMPQNPADPDFWFSQAGVKSKNDYAMVANLFGNLTLASRDLNSSLGNKNWNDKRESLKVHSKVLLNRDLLTLTSFDKHYINLRQEQMLKNIFSIFNNQIIHS